MMSRCFVVVASMMLVACTGADEPAAAEPDAGPGPFVATVVDVTYGEGAGHGQDNMPRVVMGPPQGGGPSRGSLDVVSLGAGGRITLRMGATIVDGPGADFIVFENAFRVFASADVYAEPGEVAVSEDGVTFVTFPCASSASPWTGCAGVTPTLAPGDGGISPTDVNNAGGDAFDLADVGVARALFVRITDRSMQQPAPTGGFDLDAISVVNTSSP